MKRVHFLGIGGSGASAAAGIAQAQGYKVTGCDLEPHNEFTTQFKSSQLLKGHSPKHLASQATPGSVDILAVTPAIYSLDPQNSELREARKQGIETFTWQEFLGKYLTKDKFVIAVAGTHGKTTTTAMIAKILEDAGLDPTVALGAIVPWWKTNYRVGKSKYFVVEADEFNDNFLSLTPDISVVTNIEMDHPEYFKDFKSYQKSFNKFKGKSKKIIDKPNSRLISFPLIVPGNFNILNASLAFQVGLLLEIKRDSIKQSLQNYIGIGRRFELIGEFKGAKVYSDFGHHPTEIKTTMEAAREKFPRQRIWLIFEPHMFTRTLSLFDDFVKVFKQLPVNQIIITDIYPSREVDTGLVRSQEIVKAVDYDTLVYHSKNNLKEFLKSKIKNGDIIFFMGAGDIDKLAREFVKS